MHGPSLWNGALVWLDQIAFLRAHSQPLKPICNAFWVKLGKRKEAHNLEVGLSVLKKLLRLGNSTIGHRKGKNPDLCAFLFFKAFELEPHFHWHPQLVKSLDAGSMGTKIQPVFTSIGASHIELHGPYFKVDMCRIVF